MSSAVDRGAKATPLARLIADVRLDRPRLERELASSPAALHRYAILFTGRSGSTWLASLLSNQGLYGQPREYLNAALVRRFAEEMNANTLPGYFAMLARKRVVNGVFGLKLACQQLELLLAEMAFDEAFAGYRWLYLRRRNAVAQAISSYKAGASGHHHRRRNDGPELRQRMDEADRGVGYDAVAIERSMQDVLRMERFAESVIAAHRLRPVRMFYEDMLSHDPLETVAIVHRLLFGTAAPALLVRPSSIERSGGALSVEFEDRFRRARASFVRGLEDARPAMTPAS